VPRRTLNLIEVIPTPEHLYNTLVKAKGWVYKTDMDFFQSRDKALVALLYLGDFRISEVLPLTVENFDMRDDCLLVHSVNVSKTRKTLFREAKLPTSGERMVFTDLVLDYLSRLKKVGESRLFPWSLRKVVYKVGYYTLKDGTKKTRYCTYLVGTKRAWQIVNALLPEYTQHWLRAFGYNFDYDHMDHDIMAVSDKTKADPRSLQPYLRRRYEKYRVV